MIDITFNAVSDTPKGKDPDSYSPTLRKYHKTLWSKRLPNGIMFDLDLDFPRLLHHESELGEFYLSSDAIGHTYRNVKKMSDIVGKVNAEEMASFHSHCRTIGGYTIFPSKKIDNKMTINGARGVNHKIQDRFDLTLECIRRFYSNADSPLTDVLVRYSAFFNLFDSFRGYVDFFLLQDLVDEEYSRIKYWHHFESFNDSPLPKNLSEYYVFKKAVIDFVRARNQRVLNSVSS